MMKLRKIFFFTLIFTALVFCISCKGKKDPYADLDDDITNDESDTDTDTEQTDTAPDKDDSDNNGDTIDDTSDTENDGDVNDTDIPDESHDTDPNPTDDDDPQPQDGDHDTDDDEHDNDHDTDTDTDPEDPGDGFPIPEADDASLICTGQNKCFNGSTEIACPPLSNADFFGQDAQYAKKGYCLMKSFTTSADIVTDNIFGLIWQRNLPEQYDGCTGDTGKKCTYQQAINYCSNLNYAGFSDWRLPAPEEFATIIDFGKINPTIDDSIFPMPGTIMKTFWTQTSSLFTNGKIWVVDFATGETVENPSNYFYVRCVRGGENLNVPDFKTLDNSIVEDSQYNFYWTQPTTDTMTWQEALAYCKNLEYADEKGWRLPNINELVTLLNHFTARPASQFPGMTLNYFWSSTSSEEYALNAWSINSSDGTIRAIDKTVKVKVICVK